MAAYVAGPKKALVWATAALVGVCVAIAIYLRPPSLEQVARNGLKAVRSGDASSLLRNMTRSEVSELHLSERSLSRFLDTFVRRRLSGFVPTGAPRIIPAPGSRQLLADQEYVHPDGRRAVVEITTGVTPDGPRITSAIASLTLALLTTDLPAGGTLPGGRSRHAFWARALQKALPDLASAGIVGLVRQGTPSGKDEFFTFEEFAERCRRLGAGESLTAAAGG